MIPDSLLFQGDLLFFSYFSLGAIVVILFLSILVISVIDIYHRNYHKHISSDALPLLPDLDDPNFEERLALWIRTQLSLRYAPEHSYAHTADEISHYAPTNPLVDILRNIEEYEYTSRSLEKKARMTLLREVGSVKIGE